MPGSSRELLPPYLRLSLACFASCLSPSPESVATVSVRIPAVHSDAGKALFSAGVKVWGVMLEVDNREARKVESVMAVGDMRCCFALMLHFTANTLRLQCESGQVAGRYLEQELKYASCSEATPSESSVRATEQRTPGQCL